MGRDIARVLGATTSRDGYMEGGGYQVTWAFGHLIEIYNALAESKWTVDVQVKSQREERSERMPLCPKCGQNRLHIFEKGIGCSKECGFVIWRTVAGKKLIDAQLTTLAGKGITAEVKGFTSKAGKEFSAKLKLDGEHRVVFESAGKQNQK